MGFFTKLVAACDARFDKKLRNFTLMSTTPINDMYRFAGWAKTNDDVVQTVVNRLCHLILKLEHDPFPQTVGAAKFYDANFGLIPAIQPAHTAYVESLRIRLRSGIKVYEDREGECDDGWDRFIGSDQQKLFLWGPSAIWGSGTTTYDPLTVAIHNYCWNVTNEY
jgi:hypothetical protein